MKSVNFFLIKVKIFLFILFFFSIFVIDQSSYARLINKEEFPIVVVNEVNKIYVKTNGENEIIKESTAQIQSEDGRSNYSASIIDYSPSFTTLEVLKAETRNLIDGKLNTYSVPKNMIEDQILNQGTLGFDDTRRVRIQFPQVKIGSTIYTKTRMLSKAPFGNLFSFKYFIQGLFIQNLTIQVQSEVPLFSHINNIQDVFDFSSKKNGDLYLYEIKLKKEFGIAVKDENKPVILTKQVPYLELSSHKKWSFDLLKDTVLETEKNISEKKIPLVFQKFINELKELNEFKAKKTDVKQIARVSMVWIQNQLRYLGDFRTRKGKLISRTFDEIFDTKTGDCKDFSSILVRIFREFGYIAFPAYVDRGELFYPQDEGTLPSGSDFNHQIVYVEENGKKYWFDPTNRVVYVNGPMNDIADRPAWVSDLKSLKKELIPMTSEPSIRVQSDEVRIDFENGTLDSVAKLELGGLKAEFLTGASLWYSKEMVSEEILDYFTESKMVQKYNIQPFDLVNRVLKDLSFDLTYTSKLYLSHTTSGIGINIPQSYWLDFILKNSHKRFSSLALDWPYTFKFKVFYKNLTIVGKKDLSCEISNSWLDFKRKLKQEKKGIYLEQVVQIKERFILSEEYSSSPFKTLLKEIERCANSQYLIVK